MWTRYCLSPPTRMSPSSCDLFSAEEMEWKHRFRNFGVEYRKYRDDVIMKNNYKENMMGVEVSNPRFFRALDLRLSNILPTMSFDNCDFHFSVAPVSCLKWSKKEVVAFPNLFT
ncbi:uncharacterized protein LOC120703589 isoform X2 [Panicum virgatum]|uniref:Uncharacterized protein n=1 Tax=Panicum virgatum TaxID=38727 RepID=A0A8T0TLU3_PANVG|nr:uncharacterized protein LOC120703589 isoform X2 [Panicum virgatum]XP_039843649.1 uncharacterized protein LOC120703589 isoform X2 [Panicum virgatum]KAG2611830.1 hypothetical protein PVAP13_4KG109700 [Panicum virgatum]KAG2611833.1 hypothetical protein PVAP13_4KG109700 [Panicum virgatum]